MKIQSWQELPFDKYIKLSAINTTDELQQMIESIAIINDLSIDEVKNLKLSDFNNFVDDVAFLAQEPNYSNSRYNWQFKNIEDITTDEFITYEKIKGDVNSMSYVVSMLTGIKEEKVNQMSTIDVLYAFFLFKKHFTKFINRSARSLLWQITKMKMKQKMKKVQFWRKK